MNKLQRFNVLMKAAMGIFSDRQLEEAGGMLMGFLGGQGAPPTRGTRGFLEAYSTMPWIRGIMGKIANAFASTTWEVLAVQGVNDRRARRDWALQRAGYQERKELLKIRKKQNELVQIVDHPFLDLINDANSFHTGLSLRKLTAIYLDLVGDIFWMKQRNPLGAPVAAWPLPPHWVTKVPTIDDPFYEVNGQNGVLYRIQDTEMIWMVDPDPLNPYGRGSGHMRAVGDELEVDEYAAKMVKQTFFNRARPDLIVTPKEGSLKPEDVDRLEQSWNAANQGFWRAFKPFFLRRAVEVKQLEQNFQNIQLEPMRKHQRDIVMQVFSIPPEIMGVIENANRATIDAAEYLFNEYVVVPRLEFLRSQLQARLIPEYDDRIVLNYVSPSQSDKRLELEAAKAAPWAMTIDEWREKQGLDEKEDGSGKVHMVPANLFPSATFEEPEPQVPLGNSGSFGNNHNQHRGLSRLNEDELLSIKQLVKKINK